MTDERDRQDAIRALTPILTPRLLATLDPEHVAGLALDALHDLGWRHVPRPQPITGPGRKDPAVYERGAEEAREALANRPPGPYRPNPGDTDA